MLASLPYEMPELVTRAPLDTHRSTVLPEWVDWNGHMNVAFYVNGLRPASGAFMRNMGLGRRYVDGKLGMDFRAGNPLGVEHLADRDGPSCIAFEELASEAHRRALAHLAIVR